MKYRIIALLALGIALLFGGRLAAAQAAESCLPDGHGYCYHYPDAYRADGTYVGGEYQGGPCTGLCASLGGQFTSAAGRAPTVWDPIESKIKGWYYGDLSGQVTPCSAPVHGDVAMCMATTSGCTGNWAGCTDTYGEFSEWNGSSYVFLGHLAYVFNKYKGGDAYWSGQERNIIACHEFGHGVGLNHDPPYNDGRSDQNSNTSPSVNSCFHWIINGCWDAPTCSNWQYSSESPSSSEDGPLLTSIHNHDDASYWGNLTSFNRISPAQKRTRYSRSHWSFLGKQRFYDGKPVVFVSEAAMAHLPYNPNVTYIVERHNVAVSLDAASLFPFALRDPIFG